MLVCLVEMVPRAGSRPALVRLCREWMADAAAKGCVHVEMLVDDAVPERVILLEHWESEARFDANAAAERADTELMARFAAVVGDAPLLRRLRPPGG